MRVYGSREEKLLPAAARAPALGERHHLTAGADGEPGRGGATRL
jgi:hypothetical protein